MCIRDRDYVKIAFDMTDRTNSVRVSKFLAADKAGDTASKIKNGLYCTVQGKMVYDSYACLLYTSCSAAT